VRNLIITIILSLLAFNLSAIDLKDAVKESNEQLSTVESASNQSEINALESAANDSLEFDDDFLEVDQAFELSSDRLDDSLFVRFKIADGYYLYKKRFKFKTLSGELGEPIIPEGIGYNDEYFGEVIIYRNHVEIEFPILNKDKDIELQVGFQGCADKGLCYPPTKRIVFSNGGANGESSDAIKSDVEEQVSSKTSNNQSAVSDIPQTEESRLQGLLKSGSTWIVLLTFLVAGLGLAFTPCVFPMVPILSGIISGHGEKITKRKAFMLSLVYVQAMAVTYAILGVLVAQAGSSLNHLFQTPWVIIIVATIFVTLALSMFGLYELQLPSSWQTKLQQINNSQEGGHYLSVAIMGVISTLIVSPCTTAPLTGALLYIAQSGDSVFGGLALYVLGVGMGIPLLIVGTSAGSILPKAGAWMVQVKGFFGVAMLGMALYISSFLIPGPIYLVLWAILLMVYSVFLGAFEPVSCARSKFAKGIGLVLFVIGVIYLVGAAMGNGRLNKPLAMSFTNGGVQQSAHGDFIKVTNLADIKQQVVLASQQNKTVMLDFYADWCTACFEFADYTFTDPMVKKALSNSVLLQFDATEDTEAVQEVMEHYKILGLPSILFFDSNAKELTQSRVTGFMNGELFAQHINRIFAN